MGPYCYDVHSFGLYSFALYSHGPYRNDLYSYDICSFGLYSYGLCSYGLYSNGLYRLDPYSYGLYRHVTYSYGLYSYGLYSDDLYSHGLYSHGQYSDGLYSYGLERQLRNDMASSGRYGGRRRMDAHVDTCWTQTRTSRATLALALATENCGTTGHNRPMCQSLPHARTHARVDGQAGRRVYIRSFGRHERI